MLARIRGAIYNLGMDTTNPTKEPTMNTITILGGTFNVATVPHKEGVRYLLTGARGATYTTMRNHKNPALMFLVHAGARGFGLVERFTSIALVEHEGALVIARKVPGGYHVPCAACA